MTIPSRVICFVGAIVAAAVMHNAPASAFVCDPTADCNLQIPSGGLMRSFILHVPEGYNGAKPLPLVFILHGFGGSAAGMRSLTGMNDKADAEGFFVAYLNGTPCHPSPEEPTCVGQLGWSNGLAPALGINVDDVQYIRDLIAYLESSFRIDGHRVYVAGFSNGAMMTHRLGAELADVLAAVAVAEGTVGAKRVTEPAFHSVPEAIGSIPILIMHGTADATIPLAGGTCLDGNHVCKSVADAVMYWTEQNRCRAGATQASTAAGDVVTSYRACFANSDVVQITINGGGHTWPGIATDAVWSFFSKHARTAR
jgi:polyhydroxybutyrate depolymerase